VLACLVLGYGWPPRTHAHAPTTTTVQFDREIVHVLDNHCVMCHGTQGPAFPLVTYEQTYAARWQIRQDALTRHMAPWSAVAGYGEFINDNGLTGREIDFLSSWAESFGPRNNGEISTGVAADLAIAKPMQAHIDFDRWALGKPDLLLSVPANTVAAQQADAIRRTVIDPNLKSAHWLRGIEFKPGDRRVVHFVVLTLEETGQWLGSWTPWRGFSDLPQGLAYRLPAGSHLVAEIHYYGIQGPVVDRSSLALYFTDQPSVREVSDIRLDALQRTMEVAAEVNILALQPVLGPGIRSIEVRARKPDGVTQILLFARDISLAWPTPYIFRRPVTLWKGTELSVVEHYTDGQAPVTGNSLLLSTYAGAALATDQPSGQAQGQPQGASVQHFRLSGTIRSVDAANGRLVVQHGDIPGFMGAMTMSYGVGKHEDLKKLAAGDQIQSDVVENDSETYLENIAVTHKAQ
jgi:Cu/Ag efflux protein CusF